MARGSGCDAHRRGRQRVHRLHRRHRGRQRRPLPSALRRGAQAPGRAADVRQLHHRDARRASSTCSASVTPEGLTRIQLFSGGAEAVEAGAAAGQGGDRASTRSSGSGAASTARPAACSGLLGSDFKHHLGPFLPGQHLDAVRRLLSLPAASSRYPDCGIACADYVRDVIRYQTAGEIAAIIVEPIQGTAGNVIPPDGLPARGPVDRPGARRAAHRRRDDHRVRAHRLDVGRRPRRRRARHHDRRQGRGRRLPARRA